MIDAAKEELHEEAKKTREAQPAIGAAYRNAISAERKLYVCACCGLLNFSTTGDFRKMSLAQLEPLRYTGSSEDTARWERITRAHALTGERHVEDYYISSCIFLNVSASIRLMTLANIGSGLPLGPYCHPSAGTQGPLWASCKGPSQP